MIKANFYQDQAGKIVRFKLTGHADYSVAGADIVCAGVSALTFSTFNNLERLLNQHPQLKQDQENGGYFEVSGLAGDHDCQLLLLAFQNGLLDIMNGYRQYLEVKIFAA